MTQARIVLVAGPALAALPRSTARSSIRDLIALTKPSITGNVLFTTATGLALAPGHLSLGRKIIALVGVALVVSGANTLNCFLERATDARMLRTRSRPLAAGRVAPAEGLLLGMVLATLAVPLLTFVLNPLTGLLALCALLSYVWIYTPLKQVTPKALLVGAVPGAIPPLLGWTAVTGRLDLGGALLFAFMFVWQLPHFLAITLYLKDDYARGGHRVMPVVRGEALARLHLLAWTVLLVPVSLSFVWAGLAGWPYAIAALVLGAGFLWRAAVGLRVRSAPENSQSARLTMRFSIVYLLLIFAALIADHARLAPKLATQPQRAGFNHVKAAVEISHAV